ncbi:MAG: IS66 family insertion sequence element accessory protein TnpB [Verrucomicrobiota bacterium]
MTARACVLMTNRLEAGTFSWAKAGEIQGAKMRLAPEALAMLTEGIDLKGASMRLWYQRD